MKRKTCIKQHDVTDCGAVCLASIVAFYGLMIPIARIRQYASTDKKGTNVLGLIEASNKLGLLAKGVKAFNPDGSVKLDSLLRIPKPAIAHVLVNDKLLHFVVIYDVTKKYVKIMDPAYGEFKKVLIKDFVKEWTGILILVMPDSDFKAGDMRISTFNRFAYLLNPHRKMVIQAILGAMVCTLLGLVSSIYMQKLIDYVIPDGNRNLLNMMSILMLVIMFVSLLIGYIKTVFMLKTSMQIDTRMVLGYYKHLLRLPQSFFDNMRSGEIISRMGDAVKIRTFIHETLIGLVVNVFTVVFSFALMFTYYWKLAVIMLLIIPIYFIVFMLYNRVNKIVQRRLMENAAEVQAQLVESINSSGTIKRFGLESFADTKVETKFVTTLKTGYRSAINGLIAGSSSSAISSIFSTVLLWSGTYFVLGNTITPGELLAFNALTGYFMGPVSSLVSINLVFQDAKIAADRLFEIMDLEIESVDQKILMTREQCGDIEFCDVTFRYGSREEVFENFHVRFKKGDISAIVGESGSGKTTLVSLLQNLYPLKEGQIKIGHIDIKHVNNRCLRSLICVVPQRIDLFEGTIAENIYLDDYEPDWEKVIKICQDVGILSFIEKLQLGFNTNIGENGVQLSGGQRQRLAIARALYRDPQILILDEATSALDSESELQIKLIVNDLKKQGKTILLIAHRLGTVMASDQIYVLQNGKLVEQGTHKELVMSNGQYLKFWKSQTEIC